MARHPEDDFHAPESASFRRLVEHIIDEMPGHVVVAVFLVSFLFFYGMANSVGRLAGRDLAAYEFPVGPAIGAVGALLGTAWILRVKYRRK